MKMHRIHRALDAGDRLDLFMSTSLRCGARADGRLATGDPRKVTCHSCLGDQGKPGRPKGPAVTRSIVVDQPRHPVAASCTIMHCQYFDLQKQLTAAQAELARAVLHFTVKGYTAGESDTGKHWRKRAEAAEAKLAVAEEALREIADSIPERDPNSLRAVKAMQACAERALAPVRAR